MAANKKTKPTSAKTAPPDSYREEAKPSFWQTHWQPAAAMFALAFLLYAQSLTFGYVLDDQMVIWQNSYVQKGFGGLGDIFTKDSFEGFFHEKNQDVEGGRYRPLSLATFAAEVAIFGKDRPGVGHFFNVLMYGLLGLLLFRVLRKMFPAKPGERWFWNLSFLGAAIFLLHPLHTEVVANIKGRDEILSLLGCLAALLFALKFFENGRAKWLAASGIALFFGLLAKENALTFVAVIPLTIWIFTQKPAREILGKTLPPLLAAAALFLILRHNALGFWLSSGQKITEVMNNPFAEMAAGERLATIALTLGWYLKLLFVPSPLTIDYYPFHVPRVGWSDWRVLISSGLYLVGAVWAVQKSKTKNQKSKITAWAVLYFLLTLSIVSNLFVGVGVFMGERFLFMPSVAFCVWLAWFVTQRREDAKQDQSSLGVFASLRDKMGIGVAVLLAAFFAMITWTRVPDWRDKLSLNASALRVSPNSARAQNQYASGLFEEIYLKTTDPRQQRALLDTMETHVRAALKIVPEFEASWSMLVAISAGRFENDHDVPRLLRSWEEILQHLPDNPQTRQFIGNCLKDPSMSGQPQACTAFCHRVGFEFYFQKRRDARAAAEILGFGLGMEPNNAQLQADLATVRGGQ